MSEELRTVRFVCLVLLYTKAEGAMLPASLDWKRFVVPARWMQPRKQARPASALIAQMARNAPTVWCRS